MFLFLAKPILISIANNMKKGFHIVPYNLVIDVVKPHTFTASWLLSTERTVITLHVKQTFCFHAPWDRISFSEPLKSAVSAYLITFDVVVTRT